MGNGAQGSTTLGQKRDRAAEEVRWCEWHLANCRTAVIQARVELAVAKAKKKMFDHQAKRGDKP